MSSQEGVVGVGDPALVVAEGDARDVPVDDALEANLALAHREVVVGQPADLLLNADAAHDAAVGPAPGADAGAVNVAAPLDPDGRLVPGQRREVALNERVVLAAVEEELRERSAQQPVGAEAEPAEEHALDERERSRSSVIQIVAGRSREDVVGPRPVGAAPSVTDVVAVGEVRVACREIASATGRIGEDRILSRFTDRLWRPRRLSLLASCQHSSWRSTPNGALGAGSRGPFDLVAGCALWGRVLK